MFTLDEKKYIENGFKNIKSSNPHKRLQNVRDIDVDGLGKNKSEYDLKKPR